MPLPDGFHWRKSPDAPITVTAAAFARVCAENGIDTPLVTAGYRWAFVPTEDGYDAYRSCVSLDECVEQTAVTSNPAAGTISVDVKTFTGRGRVTYAYCTCSADANVATRMIDLIKVSGASLCYLSRSATFAATVTGNLHVFRNSPSAFGLDRGIIPDVEFAPGDILRVAVSAGQAGDDMSAITYSFKEAI